MAKKDDEIKTNKNALLMFRRIIKIDYLLSNDAYPSVKEMEADDEINCSRATVMRVIDFMRYEMNAPIAYDRERGGYFYTNKTFRLPMQFMSEKEMEAINFLDHYIVNMHGSPIYEPVCTVLDMLKNSALRNPHEKPYDINGDRPDFNFNDSPDHNWLDDRLIVFVDEVDDEKAKINYGLDEADWDNLMKAMKENRVITINHYWPNKRALALRGHKPRTYKVEPFQILCDDNDWYLWALQKGEGKDRDRFRLYHFKKLDTVKMTQIT